MKKQFLFGLLAAGLLTACSNDDSRIEENKESGYELVEGQPAYISMGIALPGEAATRANEDFDDGSSDEFAVKSGKLVIFKGTSEADAELFGAYDIPTTLAFNFDGAAQITTSSAKYVQEIESPELTGTQKLFAYVILNSMGNNTGLTYVAGTKWVDFSQKVLTAIGLSTSSDELFGQGDMSSTNGLVMTSVPLSTVAGGVTDPSSGSIVTLAEIDKSAIYSTEAAAEASTTSTCIYVERAAAKVQVGLNTTTPKDLTPSKNDVTLVGWSLGNVNNSGTGSGYYNTRQVETTWSPYFNAENGVSTTKYRFVCANALLPALPGATAHAERYRTYFAKDVNYTGTGVKTGLKTSKVTTYGNGDGDYTYTYENTFDEDNQIYANTTFAGIQLKMNDGDTYYTIGGDSKTMYEDEDAAKAKLAENIAAQATPDITTIIEGINTAITAALADASSALLTAVTANGGDATSVISYSLTPVVDFGTYDATTCTYSACTATLAFKEIKQDGVVLDPTDATDADVKNAINALIYTGTTKVSDKLADPELTFTPEKVTQYTNGITYYAVRIAHFGDYETPWSAPTSAYNDYAKIYPTAGVSTHTSPITYGASRAAAWLGRWGVVRNNWYKLTIDKINAVGSPVPVDYSGTGTGEPGGTPDDNPEKFYISAHVHIVPWVLREQAVDLK